MRRFGFKIVKKFVMERISVEILHCKKIARGGFATTLRIDADGKQHVIHTILNRSWPVGEIVTLELSDKPVLSVRNPRGS